jgi:hypothetical protein
MAGLRCRMCGKQPSPQFKFLLILWFFLIKEKEHIKEKRNIFLLLSFGNEKERRKK